VIVPGQPDVTVQGHPEGVLVVREHATTVAAVLRRGIRDVERTDGLRLPDWMRTYVDQLEALSSPDPIP
jgi:hypothetical protein